MAEEKKTENVVKEEVKEQDKFELLTEEQKKKALELLEKDQKKGDLKKKGMIAGGIAAVVGTVIGAYFRGKSSGSKSASNATVGGSTPATSEPFTTVSDN